MMTFTSLDLINERNTRLLREVRAERFRGRSRKDREPRPVARRITELFQQRLTTGQETAAEEA